MQSCYIAGKYHGNWFYNDQKQNLIMNENNN
jgi:hypothetical protein